MGLFDAIGQGLSAAGYGAGELYAKQALADQSSDLELQRAQRLAEFKAELETKIGNQQRDAQASRIDAKTGELADQQLDAKRTAIQGGIADQSAWTPEQQAAVDQSLAQDRSKLLNDPKLRMNAAIQTGDISPTEAAKLGTQSEINQMKLDSLLARAEDRNATMQEIAKIRSDSVLAAAQLRVDAANQRATNGKIDTATGRMLITSEDANIKASTSQMSMLQRELQDVSQGPKGDARRKEIQDQIQGLRDDIKQSRENKASYLKSMGYLGGNDTPAASPSPTPAPAPARPAASSPAKPPLTSFLK